MTNASTNSCKYRKIGESKKKENKKKIELMRRKNTLMILTETILFVREIFAVVKAIASTCGIDAQ